MRKVPAQHLGRWPPLLGVLLDLLSLFLEGLAQIGIGLLGLVGFILHLLLHLGLPFFTGVPGALFPSVCIESNALAMYSITTTTYAGRQSCRPCKKVTSYKNIIGGNIRAEILRLLGVNEWLAQFNGHALLRLRPPPCTNVTSIARHTGDGLLLDVASDADHANAIQVLEIVAKVKFVKVEGDAELGIAGREEGRSDESDDEFRPGMSKYVSIRVLGERLRLSP